jgi:hypothetical protein
MAADRRSPFPGMDPWLESSWGDVHHEIISKLADQIAEVLPDDLFVTVGERVYVFNPDDQWQHWLPDVATFVIGPGRAGGVAEADPAVAVAEPILIKVPDEPVTEGFIEIRRLSDDRPLVTAVEVLSPTNKGTTQGRDEYLAKRADYHRPKVNLMEIDLLRGGRHLVGMPAASLRAEGDAPYKVVVRRGGELAGLELAYYPIRLRERLPRVRLPMRPSDADVVLDLQQPIDHVYRRGRYDLQIDYARPPDPPLSADDAAWAAERLAAARAV